MLRKEAAILWRAGFRPSVLRLRRDRGGVVEANLWTQDEPRLTDYLNAAVLLFGDEPGSLSWDGLGSEPVR